MNWSLRKRYGEIYVTSFPNGIDVPWKPLSFGDFIYFQEAISEARVPLVLLEEEVFRKCVVNQVFVDTIDTLPAGIVSVVADEILNVSGPYQPDLFNQEMERARHRASLYIHQMAVLVCQAFPAYKPEDVYQMKYDDLLLRLAQAESILMRAKLLNEPIAMFDSKSGPVTNRKRPSVPDEVLRAWERADNQPHQPTEKEKEKARKIKEAWEKTHKVTLPDNVDSKPKPVDPESPLLKKHGKIDFTKENQELIVAGGVGGWDKRDAALIQHKMIETARKVYPHLFNKKEEKKSEG